MSIESVRKRLEAATPGPWEDVERLGPLVNVDPPLMAAERVGPAGRGGLVPGEGGVDIYGSRADFELVALAPTDLALLLEVAKAATVLADLASVAYAPFEAALEALEASD